MPFTYIFNVQRELMLADCRSCLLREACVSIREAEGALRGQGPALGRSADNP